MAVDRRRFVAGALAATIAGPVVAAGPSHEQPHLFIFEDDFDELWGTLERRYPFFPEKATDWARVRAMYRPLAIGAKDGDAFAQVIHRVLWELYDGHTGVASLPPGSQRTPPTDLLVTPRGDALVVTAVEPDGPAHGAGVRIGDRIMAVGGRPVAPLVADLMPRCLSRPDPAATAFAANGVAAGSRGRARHFTLAAANGATRDVAIPLATRPEPPNIDWRMLPGNIGYIVIRSFADDKVVDGFNRALLAFRGTRGLVIDVSDNGGGDTAVARPIMGRFITEPKPYATMRRREGAGLGAPWTEWVDPRGPFTYTAPVVVLCSHWSGSMAEGFPMGMRAIAGAMIIGTPMMGLGAAVYQFKLDRTGLEGQYSAEPVYDVQGHPRWLLRPDVSVPDGGDILAAGLATLRGRAGQ